MKPGFASSAARTANGSFTTAPGAGRKSGATCSPAMPGVAPAARSPRYAGIESDKLSDRNVRPRTASETLPGESADLAIRCRGRFQQPLDRLDIDLSRIRIPNATLANASANELRTVRFDRV